MGRSTPTTAFDGAIGYFAPNKFFVYAEVVPSWAHQLLPQLLIHGAI